MTPRRISTKTPNAIASTPATVDACRGDRGSASDRAGRREDAIAQSESTKWHGKEAAEAPGSRR
ncbi:hypothetical protein [[Kitasatospora] papulosa]|uniref:hypothetical protein n=1 Tax=[Kitasatospora] papulosa TaxID=1464011 RepID=UPI0036916462